jgi:hypothetical protein
VGAVFIVIGSLPLGLEPSGPKVLEQLTVQELIMDLRVQALDVPVLLGAVRCDAKN